MNESMALDAEAPYVATWYDALVLFPLFVLVCTHWGLVGFSDSAGPSTLLRAVAAIMFFLAVEFRFRWEGLSGRLPFVLTVTFSHPSPPLPRSPWHFPRSQHLHVR